MKLYQTLSDCSIRHVKVLNFELSGHIGVQLLLLCCKIHFELRYYSAVGSLSV